MSMSVILRLLRPFCCGGPIYHHPGDIATRGKTCSLRLYFKVLYDVVEQLLDVQLTRIVCVFHGVQLMDAVEHGDMIYAELAASLYAGISSVYKLAGYQVSADGERTAATSVEDGVEGLTGHCCHNGYQLTSFAVHFLISLK